MASRSDDEMAEPAGKKIWLESFLDDCVASIQPSQIIRPSSPSEVNLNFAGLFITEKLKTSGRGVFADSGSGSSSSLTLSWGHGRPTSFEQHERSPVASGRGSGRLLLHFLPSPPEQFEVESDARSSRSSDNENQARAPTPERFNRYSSKKTWPQPADLFCKEAELAALEVKELNLGRLFISESDCEDYPDSQGSTVDLTMLDDTTLDELYVNLDSHPTLTRDPMDQVHWGNTVKVSNYIRDLQQPGGVGGLLLAKKLR